MRAKSKETKGIRRRVIQIADVLNSNFGKHHVAIAGRRGSASLQVFNSPSYIFNIGRIGWGRSIRIVVRKNAIWFWDFQERFDGDGRACTGSKRDFNAGESWDVDFRSGAGDWICLRGPTIAYRSGGFSLGEHHAVFVAGIGTADRAG